MNRPLAFVFMPWKETRRGCVNETHPRCCLCGRTAIATGKPDYWDFATRLELAVLAKDVQKA